jgi:putative nucleotidyltransferase with HDIG domain
MFLDLFTRKSARRAEIRKNRPDSRSGLVQNVQKMQAEGSLIAVWVACVFAAAAMLILTLRENVVPYRPGQYAPHDIVSRVDFVYHDEGQLAKARRAARDEMPRVYKPAEPDPWTLVEQRLLSLPDRVAGSQMQELPAELGKVLDAGSLDKLQDYTTGPGKANWAQAVKQYVAGARALGMIILRDEDRREDVNRRIIMPGSSVPVPTEVTLAHERMGPEVGAKLQKLAQQQFVLALQPKVVEMTLRWLGPTHVYDDVATAEAKNRAEEQVPSTAGDVPYKANMRIVQAGEISQDDWKLLKAENDEFNRRLRGGGWTERLGVAGTVAILTIVLCAYIVRYQPRVVRNHARAIAIAGLMLAMLFLAQIAAVGTSQLYLVPPAAVILVAMIMAIAYDQRFALGVATFQAVLVTLALSADLSYFLILEAGVITCCFILDDLRTRSKLVEVGGATALAMIAATLAAGAIDFDPPRFIARNCLYVGAAGLAVGFVVLGILPFIEKTFRITTSMTLLELADASQPLLRRLALEAPGTYNHSLQVATLAEEAAKAIGGNSLLCRVASYYHDVGKINKAEYFVENQTDGTNRHINLSPSVSLLIIIGHVKDGIELAREYNLPTSIFPFIQQHHGTTLVEFFYHRACDTCAPDQPGVSEMQYRYPGPKPKSREIAVVMLADAVESATRAMSEPTPSRIETLVHDLAMKRLLDGQFDECDLTMRELELVERSLTKSLLAIYHGRIAYPSTIATTTTAPAPAAPAAAARSA